ncbi:MULTISPECIES: hypothetical protein [unclassified Pseudomonas]|uniref:hypothetical protein n=1 Tax=unclassified Pseudomonas TaxID=196821 RepID=UPI001889001B|nr:MULTISPECIES: hypothetical protein [unclassified Pseudomonas]QOY72893.1 hypothetical protein IH404_07515 [Pseudomonas sp. OST1909]WPN52745.1 hypothetical protein QMK52_00960 [Pseudomonas sp. P9_2]
MAKLPGTVLCKKATEGDVTYTEGGGEVVIDINVIRNMLAMARAHQALERHDAQEQARNKLTGNPSDGPASAKMITPPDEDTDRPITFS